MKRLLPLGLLAALCLTALVSCGGTPPALTVAGVPWPDDEVTQYRVEDVDGNAMGTANMTVHRDGETYLLEQSYIVADQQVIQNISVRVNADDLKPLAGTQTIETADSAIEIASIYYDNTLSVVAIVNGEQQSATFDIPADTYDNDESLFLLRTIPFEVGYTASYTNAVPSAGMFPKATLSVVAEEQVNAPAGAFDCYKLKLSATGATIYIWYAVDPPHYLVKYDNSATVLLLTEHP
ncbi:MAG: DUF3108 domain-containing protein [Chloroflexota bacterium]|nr:DUF3108 domain-containing protein [Chloroflexota bacterium]